MLDTSNNINPSENIKLLNYFMDKNILWLVLDFSLIMII
jgi:hypothetical protein